MEPISWNGLKKMAINYKMNKLETKKAIPDFPGYFATKSGRIWSASRKGSGGHGGKFLKPTKRDRAGHLAVDLCKDNQTCRCSVHRLVLQTFVGPCPLGMEGCHNNGNPSYNWLSNLRWDTRSANALDAVKHGTRVDNRGSKQGQAKLNEAQVRVIKWLLKRSALYHREIAEVFGVHSGTISSIKYKRSWKHI